MGYYKCNYHKGYTIGLPKSPRPGSWKEKKLKKNINPKENGKDWETQGRISSQTTSHDHIIILRALKNHPKTVPILPN